MNEKLRDEIEKKQGTQGFIKVTDRPVQSLNSEQKVILNRKGNVMFNEGEIEGARRLFTTTGYSDESLKALKQYVLAHNKSKAEPIYEKIASVISKLLREN